MTDEGRDLARRAAEHVERLRLALVALWPDRPVVYFSESSGQAMGPGPVLTDEERQQLSRVADAIGDAAARAREEGRRSAVDVFAALFSGGPDTACRTTWRDPLGGHASEVRTVECVEVPVDDLRAAFVDAGAQS